MNNKLRLLMVEFEKCLDQYCNIMYNKLEQPLQVSTINQSLGKVNIDDENLRTYYAWKNGINYDAVLPTNAFDYSSFGVMPTLEFASDVSYENNNSDHMWDSSLFPVIASFGGDFFCIIIIRKTRITVRYFYILKVCCVCPVRIHILTLLNQ